MQQVNDVKITFRGKCQLAAMKVKSDVKKVEKKVVKGAINVVEWVADNPREAAAAVTTGSVAIKVIDRAVRGINHDKRIKSERELKELYIYDRSIGAYHKLKRPLKQSEVKAIAERKANGEKLVNILNSMKVLN